MLARWSEHGRRLRRVSFVLMGAFLAAFLLQVAVIYFGPPQYETRVLFDLEHPERNGDLIRSGISTFDTILAVAVVLTGLGFLVGLVLLIVSLYRRPVDATPNI